MDNLFLPSPQRAAELRLSMTSSLRESLATHLHATELVLPAPLTGQLVTALPSDFTAYFDLLTNSNSADNPSSGPSFDQTSVTRCRLTLSRLNTPQAPQIRPESVARPRLSTLRSPFFHPDEQKALVRWWDMEPQNALNLEAVDDWVLEASRCHLTRALDELECAAPDIYNEVLTIVRDIVLTVSGSAKRMDFGGISSFAAWGAIAINAESHTHWTHFFKTIVHECAHLQLFAIAREQPLLLNSSSEHYASPLRDDPRPLDGIFHAAYVSARESIALDACLNHLEAKVLTGECAASLPLLEQQLESSVLAFWDCCEQLANHAQLSTLGTAVLKDTQSCMLDTFDVISSTVESP